MQCSLSSAVARVSPILWSCPHATCTLCYVFALFSCIVLRKSKHAILCSMEGELCSLPLVSLTHVAQYPERMMHRVNTLLLYPQLFCIKILCCRHIHDHMHVHCEWVLATSVFMCIYICVCICVFIPVTWKGTFSLTVLDCQETLKLTPQAQTQLRWVRAWLQNGAILW